METQRFTFLRARICSDQDHSWELAGASADHFGHVQKPIDAQAPNAQDRGRRLRAETTW